MKLAVVAHLALHCIALGRAQVPPNDRCSGATVVNPRNPIPRLGNTNLAALDNVRENTCNLSYTESLGTGLWYKFASSTYAEVTATTNNNGTDLDTVITVFVGKNCNSLSCVGYNDDCPSCGYGQPSTIKFFTEPNKTYWIVPQGFRGAKGFFNLTVSTSPTAFFLVNSITDRPISIFQDLSYSSLPVPQLNIQLAFDSVLSSPPKSVRMTFDNPPRSFCDNAPPFSVFGDSKGNYFDAKIPIGDHEVTATPYKSKKCRGSAGPTQKQSFSMGRCGVTVSLLDVAYNFEVERNAFTEAIDYLPCSLNILANIACGFVPKEVKLELRNNSTNALLFSRISRSSPYYLFGDVQGKPLSQEIPGGAYKFSVIVDGIKMDDVIFFSKKSCAKNIPPNDFCANATSFVLNSGVPFQTMGDTTNAVLDRVREYECFNFDDTNGLWYKFTTPRAPFQSKIVASTCNPGTKFDTRVSVVVGNDCNSLSCLNSNNDSPCSNSGASSVAIFGEPNKTYWVMVNGVDDNSGVFHLTIDSEPDVFFLVNSMTDRSIDFLQDELSYENVPVSQLNIQANYDPNRPTPRSVRLTFDNPARNICDNTPPFSVFGDLNGDFFNAKIPVGNHTVTAVPYNGTNCSGVAGRTRIQSFSVRGCKVSCFLYNAIDEGCVNGLVSEETTIVENLPCSLNIEAEVTCGFSPNEVKLVLRNTVTNTLVVSRIKRESPYFLFGDNDGRMLAGSLPPGEYQLTPTIDGITMNSFDFIANGECVEEPPQQCMSMIC